MGWANIWSVRNNNPIKVSVANSYNISEIKQPNNQKDFDQSMLRNAESVANNNKQEIVKQKEDNKQAEPVFNNNWINIPYSWAVDNEDFIEDSTIDNKILLNAAKGCIIGAFVGDAAGAVLEFFNDKISRKDVEKALLFKGGGRMDVLFFLN